jgi:ribonuclease HI
MGMDEIHIFCDGGCRGNQFDQNIGGWGVVLEYKGQMKEIYGNCKNTTNNIMELTSCIKALEAIKTQEIPIIVTMDSQYVITGINEWINGWIKKGWRGIKNVDLWQSLYELKNQFGNIKFTQCRGHADNNGNNRADYLANKAMDEGVTP